MVLLGWLWLKEPRPGLATLAGLAVGFCGLALLVRPEDMHGSQSARSYMLGVLAVLGATVSWAIGSIYSKRATLPPSPIMASAAEMLTGGAVMFLFGLLRGELRGFDPTAVPASSWYGLLYLIVGGSLIGFTAYVYILKHARPAMVSTYAYVNPVIAVVLGWLIGGEPLTRRTVLAASLIVGAVVLISARGKAQPEGEP
jgi:drug/metabolite transporter (DMT)-like permease